ALALVATATRGFEGTKVVVLLTSKLLQPGTHALARERASVRDDRRAVLNGMAGGAKPLALVKSQSVLLACACLFPHFLGDVGRIHEVEWVRQAHRRFRCHRLARRGRRSARRGGGRGALRV